MTYDIESIVIKVLANASGNLVIPLKGYSDSGALNCPYDWKISVDDGAETSYSGTGGGVLTIGTGLVAGSEHLVIIKPTTVDYQWARAFGTDGGSEAAYITEIVQDASYMGYGLSATNAGNYFKAYQYQNCSKLINVVPEVLPDTVTTIGNNFLASLYQGTKISEPTNEVMPNSVTSIGTGFRKAMYRATNIEYAPDEVMSDNITTTPNDFRLNMYYGCQLLKAIPNEVLPNALTSIGNNFRSYMFGACSSLDYAVDEYIPDSVTTIGTNFRKNQYNGAGVKSTAKEYMPSSLQSIGTYARDYQYYNCANLTTIVGESNIGGATVGTGYRRGQYYTCTSLQKARLYAFGGVTNYRQYCFYGITNPITITILGDIVDKPTSQGALSNTNVNKIYVDSDLVASYKSSSSRSSIDDDKFVGIPHSSFNSNLLLGFSNRIDKLSIYDGRIDTSLLKIILNGTENWTESGGVFSFSVSGNTQYGWVLSTHGEYKHDVVYNLNQWYWNSGVCFNNNMGFTLASFKAWLAQEYADGTPVIIIGLDQYTEETYVTPQSINTKDGENLIEITQGGPDVNDLQAQITVEQSTGGYTANVFNGEDYSVESDWIEISDQEVDKGGDVVGPNSSTDGNVALFDGNTGKIIKDSGVNLSSKQDVLTAGPNITLSCDTISGDFNYAEPTSAAACTTKCVCIPEITQLCTGQTIIVKPTITATNCATSIKLNDFTAYPVRYNNAALTSTTDGYVWGANQLSEFIFDGSYWHVLSKSYDTNTTYTINYSYDAGKYKAGSGSYAISRYSLVMQKQDMTWEKIVATNQNYSTGTSHNVNTNGFILNQLRYYNTTTNLANGANAAANSFSEKAASVDLRYSTNCGGVTNWGEGDYIYIVGTMGNDGLFYLDTTTRWTNKLPTTKDGKLYIRIGLCLATGGYTCTLFDDRPIFYYDNGIKEYRVADNKQDTLISGTNIKTINGCDVLGSGDLCIAGGVSSVNGQTGAVCLSIPTDNCELANGCGYQFTSCMVCTLSGADNCHYPTAKTVADALSCAGAGDMMKSVYDPCNCEADAFDYCNFHNTPTIPTDNCQLANGCGYTTCTGTLSSCADVISALGYTPYNSTNPCGYTTCTGTLVAADIACLAQCCDIPTDNCQLANGCGYTTCTGTLSTCGDITTALGYTPYSAANPCGYTTCTGTVSSCADIISKLGYTPYSSANPNGYTSCTGTLVPSNIACINGCCLTNGGDVCIQGGQDYSWVTKTISGGQVELGLRTIVNTPTSDFTLVKPATLIDGEEYAIRVISGDSYCMCLGSCFKNPWEVDTCLSGHATDQYVFLSIGGELELQPLINE